MQVEDRLAGATADVDDHAVVLEVSLACRLGDELEHALRLLRAEVTDVAKRVDVALGKNEEAPEEVLVTAAVGDDIPAALLGRQIRVVPGGLAGTTDGPRSVAEDRDEPAAVPSAGEPDA